MIVYEMRKSKSGNFKYCNDSFTEDAGSNFFPETCSAKHNDMTEKNLDCSTKNFDALKCCVCVARHTAVTTLRVTSLNSATRD